MRWSLAAWAVAALQSPVAGLEDRRTDLCDRWAAVQNGSLALHSALEGLTLQVAVPYGPLGYGPLWADLAADNTTWSGYVINLLDAVAEKAGFAYEPTGFDSLYIGEEYEPFYEALFGAPNHFGPVWVGLAHTHDFVASGFPTAPEVQAYGMRTPFVTSWFDDMLVVPTTAVGARRGLWSFAAPFHWRLWLVTGAVMCATGAVYLAFEQRRADEFSPPRSRAAWLGEAVFQSAAQLSGGGGFSPTTCEGKARRARAPPPFLGFVCRARAVAVERRASGRCNTVRVLLIQR
jgi:hypothetical protein